MHRGWIVAAVVAAGLSGAPASARTGERFELLWRVKPQPVPAEPFWVREQGVVAASTLMPEAARVAERDLVGGRGEKLAPAGTHFAKVRSGGDVFCTVARRERGPADAARWLVDGRRLCVVDGTAYFSVGSGGYYWFSLSGKVPALQPLAAPAALAPLAPEAFEGGPVIELHYQRFLDKGNWLQRLLDQASRQPVGPDEPAVRFHLQVGTAKRTEWMVRGCGDPTPPTLCASGGLPARFAILGLSGEIVERRGEDLRFRLLTSFAAQPFSLVETGPYTQGTIFEGGRPRG